MAPEVAPASNQCQSFAHRDLPLTQPRLNQRKAFSHIDTVVTVTDLTVDLAEVGFVLIDRRTSAKTNFLPPEFG